MADQHLHGRGLAGAVRAQDTAALTGIDREGDPVDHPQTTVILGQTAGMDDGETGWTHAESWKGRGKRAARTNGKLAT
jgi:hypothetical protein